MRLNLKKREAARSDTSVVLSRKKERRLPPDAIPRPAVVAEPGLKGRAKGIARGLVIFGAALLSGIPAASVASFLDAYVLWVAFQMNFEVAAYAYTFANAINAAIGVLALLGTPLLVPFLWRRFSKPGMLRTLAYLAVQIVAIGVGMVFPDMLNGSLITWALAGAGTIGWWNWQLRWRGIGVAPSPLAGVLRPHVNPGQIWFGIVPGRQQTKVRPVMVLGVEPDGKHWRVAYFTTQAPKTAQYAKNYVQVTAGTLRGFQKDNWVSLTDARALSRSQFRTYTGLAPKWLYEQVCAAHNVPLSDEAHTIDEELAGQGHSPTYKTIAKALGLLKSDERIPDIASWETAWALMRLPIDAKRPARSQRSKKYSGPHLHNDK